MLKSQTVAEKMAKTFRGPLFSAAPCSHSIICSSSRGLKWWTLTEKTHLVYVGHGSPLDKNLRFNIDKSLFHFIYQEHLPKFHLSVDTEDLVHPIW